MGKNWGEKYAHTILVKIQQYLQLPSIDIFLFSLSIKTMLGYN